MVGYTGIELQQRLQRRAEETLDRASSVPGYCNGGRVVAVDDLRRIGSAAILSEIESHGALALRMLPSEQIAEATRMATEAGCRIDFHDTFVSKADPAREIAQEIVSSGPLLELKHLKLPLRGDDPLIARLQAFLLATGINPFSGSMLTGELNRSRTFVLVDETGEIAAVSHTYLPHNASSKFHLYAWAGLVAVSPKQRGKSVGRYINACAILAAFTDLGADAVYELVHESNAVSRRMVESCGLRHQPAYKTGTVTSGAERFTR